MCFFYVKFSCKKQRSLKLTKQTKTKKTAFLCGIKTSKRKKIACLTFFAFHSFCVFYAHIKHLNESCLFMFCAFCEYKKHMSENCLFAFCAFCACGIFSWKNEKIKLPWYPQLYYYHYRLHSPYLSIASSILHVPFHCRLLSPCSILLHITISNQKSDKSLSTLKVIE